jgi:hypothetical protein
MHPLVERFKNEKRWKDKCLLLEIIHIKMKQQKKLWRIRDTAKMLNLSVGLVSEDLQLARKLVDDEEISKCESRNKAIKLLRHGEQQ